MTIGAAITDAVAEYAWSGFVPNPFGTAKSGERFGMA